MRVATRERTALTHRLLETARTEASAYRIPDARCPGLAVRVAPSGVVSFDLAFRVSKSGKFRRLSLGKFPDVSLEGARDRANELTRAARLGRDLIAEEEEAKRATESRPIVEKLIAEYLTRRVNGRLRTAREIELRLARTLAPIADRPIADIHRRDLRRLLDATADAGHAREAEQRRITLNGFFRWALAQDFTETNPTVGLVSYGRSPPRNRKLTPEEIRKFWLWLPESEMPTPGILVLRLQLCTGARASEIGGMRVEEIDAVNWIWRLPAERSKNKRERITPIVGLAREMIRDRLAKCAEGPLFTTKGGKPLSSLHIGHFLLNHVPPIAKMGSHDLRRSVASEMAEGVGLPLEAIARVIGHTAGSSSTVTLLRHYINAEFLTEKTNALLRWDAHLRAIIDGVLRAQPTIIAFPLRANQN